MMGLAFAGLCKTALLICLNICPRPYHVPAVGFKMILNGLGRACRFKPHREPENASRRIHAAGSQMLAESDGKQNRWIPKCAQGYTPTAARDAGRFKALACKLTPLCPSLPAFPSPMLPASHGVPAVSFNPLRTWLAGAWQGVREGLARGLRKGFRCASRAPALVPKSIFLKNRLGLTSPCTDSYIASVAATTATGIDTPNHQGALAADYFCGLFCARLAFFWRTARGAFVRAVPLVPVVSTRPVRHPNEIDTSGVAGSKTTTKEAVMAAIFTPAQNQADVQHLKVIVKKVYKSSTGYRLDLLCGDLSFDFDLDRMPQNPFRDGERLLIEQPINDNPFAAQVKAIYRENDLHTPVVRNPLMSSREIAQLTGKAHCNVLRDISTMRRAFEQNSKLSYVLKSTTYKGRNGQNYKQYELDKNTCLTLLLGYDAVARFKVVARWQELEEGIKKPLEARDLKNAVRETARALQGALAALGRLEDSHAGN